MTPSWVVPWLTVGGVYVLCFLLVGVIKGDEVDGYVVDRVTRKPLVYKLNGLRVLVVMTLLGATLVHHDLVPGDVFVTHYWQCLLAGCTFGLVGTLCMLARGVRNLEHIDKSPFAPTTTSYVAVAKGKAHTAEFDARSYLEHFWCGLEYNPRVWGVDVKMYLYLVGAVQLELVLCSGLYVHLQQRGEMGASRAFCCYAACFTFFLVEYMHHEWVHTFTYDIFRERLGFKLVWGCLCFYPWFYCVGMWALLDAGRAGELDPHSAAACVALFFAGWVLTRGANLQKHAFRHVPTQASGKRGGSKAGSVPPTFTFGLITVPQTSIGNKILCGGWWGVSRHINYAGEIIQGLALALISFLATGSYVPFLYPLYYVSLFVPRQIDDDKICAQKYGAVWAEYEKRVPARIVPYLY